MTDKIRSFFTVIAPLSLVVVMMICMTACNNEEQQEPDNVVNTPAATYEPGEDYYLEISGPTEFKKDETVEYLLDVKKCAVSEGLLSLDFNLEYNGDILEYDSTEFVTTPPGDWEIYTKADKDAENTLIFACFDDDIENAVTGEGQLIISVKFKVTEESSDNATIMKLYNCAGTINDAELTVAVGTGNTITKE